MRAGGRRLGNWTTSRAFEVRARRSSVVLDLRSPEIAEGDIELQVDLAALPPPATDWVGPWAAFHDGTTAA